MIVGLITALFEVVPNFAGSCAADGMGSCGGLSGVALAICSEGVDAARSFGGIHDLSQATQNKLEVEDCQKLVIYRSGGSTRHHCGNLFSLLLLLLLRLLLPLLLLLFTLQDPQISK